MVDGASPAVPRLSWETFVDNVVLNYLLSPRPHSHTDNVLIEQLVHFNSTIDDAQCWPVDNQNLLRHGVAGVNSADHVLDNVCDERRRRWAMGDGRRSMESSGFQ